MGRLKIRVTEGMTYDNFSGRSTQCGDIHCADCPCKVKGENCLANALDNGELEDKDKAKFILMLDEEADWV